MLMASCRDVEDTAAAHLKALSPSVPGNQRYLFHGPGVMLGDEVANFVRQKYSELRSRIPAGEENVEVPPGLIKTDTSRAEKVFGIKWKSWQESVPDMVKDIERWEREGLIEED
jgi:dTDP-4-dehydrorhamnose reductase